MSVIAEIPRILFREKKCQYTVGPPYGVGCDIESNFGSGCQMKVHNQGQNKDFPVERLTNGLRDVSCVGLNSPDCPLGKGFRYDHRKGEIIKTESHPLHHLAGDIFPRLF